MRHTLTICILIVLTILASSRNVHGLHNYNHFTSHFKNIKQLDVNTPQNLQKQIGTAQNNIQPDYFNQNGFAPFTQVNSQQVPEQLYVNNHPQNPLTFPYSINSLFGGYSAFGPYQRQMQAYGQVFFYLILPGILLLCCACCICSCVSNCLRSWGCCPYRMF